MPFDAARDSVGSSATSRACRRQFESSYFAVAAADLFTTEVWTARGSVTSSTLFVIESASRRVHVIGSTLHSDERFMLQAIRDLTDGRRRPLARLGARPRSRSEVEPCRA